LIWTDFIKLVLVILLIAAPLFAAEEATYTEVRQVMGTLAEVQVWASDLTTAEAAADSAFAIFTRIDSLMSTWNGNSALSRFNSAPPGRWFPVGPEIIQVLECARTLSDLTTGAFDPTVLPLMKLWGFRGGQPVVPETEMLSQLLGRIGLKNLQTSHNCARFLRPDCGLDFGGIAKDRKSVV